MSYKLILKLYCKYATTLALVIWAPVLSPSSTVYQGEFSWWGQRGNSLHACPPQTWNYVKWINQQKKKKSRFAEFCSLPDSSLEATLHALFAIWSLQSFISVESKWITNGAHGSAFWNTSYIACLMPFASLFVLTTFKSVVQGRLCKPQHFLTLSAANCQSQ